jgi:hypothetical protein
LYNLLCESAASMFNLRDVVTYIAKRVGLIPGRIWFGGNGINVKLTAQQRRNFLTVPQPPRAEAVSGGRRLPQR